jgi:hypothetical protein
MYPDIYPWVRAKLRDSLNGVENSELDLDIRSVLREILGPYSLTYGTLSPSDKELVDEAAGLRTAARVHGQYVTGGVSTDLRSDATDDVKRSYGDADKLKNEWLADASRALAATSFGRGRGDTGPRFGVSGPSRARCAARGYDGGCDPCP